jgi:hypothetical protein
MVGDEVYFSRCYGCYLINCTVDEFYRIDFVNQGGSVVPIGSIVNVPGRAVNNIYVRNDGPALVQYSINGGELQDMIGGILVVNNPRDLKFKDTNCHSVNFYIRPTGGNLFATIDVETTV